MSLPPMSPPPISPPPMASECGCWLPGVRRGWGRGGRGGLAGQAGRLAGWVGARPGLDLVGVGWSLATTRSVFEYRAVVTGDLMAGLAALAAGEPAAGVITGTADAAGAGRGGFVFPGGGGQGGGVGGGGVLLVLRGRGGRWGGMGRELAGCCPVFAARLAECGAALAPFVGWDLGEVLGDEGALGRVEVVQPALWAVMVSLAAVWEAAGVVPDAVVGHSQGEIAAATVAG